MKQLQSTWAENNFSNFTFDLVAQEYSMDSQEQQEFLTTLSEALSDSPSPNNRTWRS